MAEITVRPLENADRSWAGDFLESHGSRVVAEQGELLSPLELPGLVACAGLGPP